MEQAKTKTWGQKHIEMLKTQKARNELQELIIQLSSQPEKASKLEVLLKSERAKERAKNAERAASKLLGASKKAERSARTHRLIQLGLLVDFAGLEGRSRAELLGALINTAQYKPEHWTGLGIRGERMLAEKEKKQI